MSIEFEIKQSQFRNDRQRALINIIYTHNYLINQLNTVFKKYKITRQQYNVLRIIRGAHPAPVTINDIKERMLDKMSDASRIVDRLKAKGLIQRTQSPHDRRSVEVRITKEGLRFLDVTDPEVEKFDLLFSNLEGEEVETLNLLLDKIRT